MPTVVHIDVLFGSYSNAFHWLDHVRDDGTYLMKCGWEVQPDCVVGSKETKSWPSCRDCRATRKTAYDVARDKGAAAKAAGLSEADNPYPDLRTDSNKVTFSRAFRRSWLEGYRRA